MRDIIAKGVQEALESKFEDLLPASESTSSQTAKKREAVKSNINGMSLIIRKVKNASLLTKIESTVSDDWPNGRTDLAVAMLDKKQFRTNNKIAMAEQKQKLVELTLKDGKDPGNIGTQIVVIETEFNNVLAKVNNSVVICSVTGEK